MKRLAYLIMILSAGIFFSCTTENEWDDYFSIDENINMGGNGGGMMPGGTASSGTALTTTLGTFDVTIDTSALTETETIPGSTDTYYEDYVETYTPTTTIKIAYNGNSATVSGESEGVTVTKEGADVTVNSTVKNIAYELSGTTSDGSFKIYSEKKFEVILNGVDIPNPTGAAINNQGKRMYVVVKDGTTNKLTDGSSYTMVDNEDMKGTLFSEGKLAFSGSGTLSVYSNAKNGIVSDDYVFIRPNTNIYVKSTTNHGIKTNDGVIIRGGVVNVEVSADAAKGINTDGFIQIEGGRVTAITSGGSSYDSEDKEYKGCAGIKSDSIFVISGGEVNVKSTGAGGKGLNSSQTMTITGGTIRAIAAGKNFSSGNDDVAAKAIKSAGDMTISGGDIMARSAAHEAIETKGKLTVSAGSIGAYSSDDAINSAGVMTINGGYIFGYSTTNDGIDANGNLTVNGGVLIGCGATAPEEGIDVAERCTFSINGGTVIGIGGGSESIAGSQQKAVLSGVTVNNGSYITVKDDSGNNIFAFKVPRAYSRAVMQLSSPKFKSGTTYTMSTATSVSGSDEFFGYYAGATVSSETKLGTFTTSTSSSSGMRGGMSTSDSFQVISLDSTGDN